MFSPAPCSPAAMSGDRGRNGTKRLLLGDRVELSGIDLPGDSDSIIDLDAEIANSALDPRMSEQQLSRPRIVRTSVDQDRRRVT